MHKVMRLPEIVGNRPEIEWSFRYLSKYTLSLSFLLYLLTQHRAHIFFNRCYIEEEKSMRNKIVHFTRSQSAALRLELAGLVRRLREEHGLTQEEFASLLGVHRNTVASAERGDCGSTPSRRFFRALSILPNRAGGELSRQTDELVAWGLTRSARRRNRRMV